MVAVFIVAGGGILYWWSQGYEYIDTPRGGETVVAFGDSLVAGVGATKDGGFVSLLSQRLDMQIINAGVPGDTSAYGIARLERDVLSYEPSIVILLLGGNDAIRRLPVKETFSNLETIIERIHATGAAVLLLGVRGGLLRDSYKKEFRSLAERTKVSFVPNVLDDIFANPKNIADPIHPNDEGYTLIADRIEPALRSMLENTPR